MSVTVSTSFPVFKASGARARAGSPSAPATRTCTSPACRSGRRTDDPVQVLRRLSGRPHHPRCEDRGFGPVHRGNRAARAVDAGLVATYDYRDESGTLSTRSAGSTRRTSGPGGRTGRAAGSGAWRRAAGAPPAPGPRGARARLLGRGRERRRAAMGARPAGDDDPGRRPELPLRTTPGSSPTRPSARSSSSPTRTPPATGTPPTWRPR